MLTINPMNNNSQSFGMAYDPMKGVDRKIVSRKIAEEIHASNAPGIIKEELKQTIEAIKALKTQVLTDGDKVIVQHPVTSKEYEVLNYSPWHNDKESKKVINYCVKEIKKGFNFENPDNNATNITIRYAKEATGIGSPAWDAAYAGSPILRKHIIAKEIATDFDKQLAQKVEKEAEYVAKENAIDKTANEFEAII